MALTLLATNNAESVLASAISATDTSLIVSAGTGAEFPDVVAGESYFKLTITDAATGSQIEIVNVTAKAGDIFTIERAQEGTTAKSWLHNDFVANMMTAETINYVSEIAQELNQSVQQSQAAAEVATTAAEEAVTTVGSAVKQLVTFDSGGTLYSALDRISDGTYFYYWTGFYPVTIPPGSTMEGTGGVKIGFWAPDTGLPLQSALATAVKQYIGVLQGGYLENYLPQVSIDAFGADPTGVNESTQAYLDAIAAVKTVTNSCYVTGDRLFFKIVIGNGQYKIGDAPLYCGCAYKGQGRDASLIFPVAGASWIFTTEGTLPYNASSSNLNRMLNTTISDMSFGCAIYENLITPPVGVGGINIQYASYITMQNVRFRRLDGMAMNVSELWDSDFINVTMMYCGNIRDASNPVPALAMNMGAGSDGCNAVRFYGLHIESCPKSMALDIGCRHVFFNNPKIEDGGISSVSSTITGGAGVVFNIPELTWSSNASPMFLINRTSSYESFGVVFNTPVCVGGGSSPRGWYFNHTSTSGAMSVINPICKYVKTLITGINYTLDGGTSYACGPQFISGSGNAIVRNHVATAIQSSSTAGPAATDGTDDYVIMSGAGNVVENMSFQASGSTSDGLAFVNILNASGDVRFSGCQYSGSRQYGGRGNLSTYKIINNSVVNGGSIGTVYSGGNPKYVLANPDVSGLGFGGFKSASITISSGASGSIPIISGATTIIIRGSSLLGYPAAKIFADANFTTIALEQSLGGIFATGTGTAGDGKVYVSKSGANLILTNFNTNAATFYVTALSAVM